MKHTAAGILLSWVTVCFCSMTSAQVLPIRTYTVEDGLISNRIRSLFQDSHGFLWIGTSEGFSIFDGTVFRNYASAAGRSLGQVTSFAQIASADHTILFSTSHEGVFSWTDGTITRMPHVKDSTLVVAQLFADSGVTYCATTKGLYLLTDSTFEPLPVMDQHIAKILPTSDGSLYLLQNLDVLLFHPHTSTVERIAMPLGPDEDLGYGCIDLAGDLWVGTLKGRVARIRGTEVIQWFAAGVGYTNPGIDDGQGFIWAGHGAGITRIAREMSHRQTLIRLDHSHGLPDGAISIVLKDREGTIWFGSYSAGIAKLTYDNIVRFPIPDVSGFARQDSNRHIWISTGTGMVEIWMDEDGLWHQHAHNISSAGFIGPPMLLAFNTEGHLFVTGRDAGIARFQIVPRRYGSSHLISRNFSSPQMSSLFSGVWSMAIDRSDRIWYGVPSGNTHMYDLNADRQYTFNAFAPDTGSAYKILPARNGKLWFGEYARGLVVLDSLRSRAIGSESFRRITKLPDQRIRALFESLDGRIWVGTLFGGLAVIDKDTIVTLSMEDGLPSNQIWDIAEDVDGRIWVGTSQGLCYLDTGAQRSIHRVPTTSGLTIQACGALPEGYVWGLDPRGITISQYKRPTSIPIPPPVFITSLRVNGEERLHADQYEFRYDQNHCEVEFTGVSLKGDRPVQYQYMLEDADANWHEPTPSRQVTLAALKPGRYTFAVRAITADGIMSSKPATIAFTVLQPVWQTWWFIALACGLIVGTITFVVRLRIRNILQLDRLRMRIAQDLHDDVGSNLTGIAIASKVVQERQKRGEQSQSELSEIAGTAMRTLDLMRDIVWLINPANDSLDDLLLRMRETASTILGGTEYSFHPLPQLESMKIDLECKRNIFLMYKEILTNCVKHARATKVEIGITHQDRTLQVSVRDNGIGFDPSAVHAGNGIRNLRSRADAMKAALRIESREGEGTIITISAPLT